MQQQSTRYDQSNTCEISGQFINKQTPQKLLFYSSSKYTQTSSQKRPLKYRYSNNNEPLNSVPLILHNSYNLNSKSHHNAPYFQVSQINHNTNTNQRNNRNLKSQSNHFHNPYLNTNRKNYAVKQIRSLSQKNRKLISQPSTRQVSIKMPIQKLKSNKTQVPIHPQVQALIEQSKSLSNSKQHSQSQLLTQQLLHQYPDSLQLLFTSANNTYQLQNFNKTINTIQKIIEINPTFNKEMYLIKSKCYENKKMFQQAIQNIDLGIKLFYGWYQGYLQKSYIYQQMGNIDHQIKSLKKAIKFAKDLYECTVKMGECYEKLEMVDCAIKIYSQFCQKNISTQKMGVILLKKANLQKKQQKYSEYVKTLISYSKVIDESNLSQLYYQIAYIYYKMSDYLNSVMYLQQVLLQKNQTFTTNALILLTIIHIKKRDFYQASHSLQRKQHLRINEQSILIYSQFCEGVLFLMKRKFQCGLQKLQAINWETQELSETQEQLTNIEGRNKFDRVSLKQFRQEIFNIYDFYLSYAYFCLGNTDVCISLYQKILSNINCPAQYRPSIQFNLSLCLGLHHYNNKNLPESRYHFTQATKIYPDKPEGYLNLSITLVSLYLSNPKPENSLLQNIMQNLQVCLLNLKELSNNYAAYAYYVKSAISAYAQQWDNAINQIDEAIERAEDNNDRSFYLRALILACCQNFKQAIGEVSIAISLNEKVGKYYLLKARCEQIEGDGNKAFLDLQEYIALCPQDTEIHKFAGHLLFQNGAFQDAIQAYENGQISIAAQNYNVFLTKSKTHFLLGQFQKCVINMQIANNLNLETGTKDMQIQFDVWVIKIIDKFYQNVPNQGNNENKQALKVVQLIIEELRLVEKRGQPSDYGKIFKKVQISMLLSMFMFYAKMYKQSAKQFKQTILLKEKMFNTLDEDQIEEQGKQKDFFISQMHYNRAICYLMIKQSVAASKCLDQCILQPESKTLLKMDEFITMVKNKNIKQAGEVMRIEVFSQKNKMSRLLSDLNIKISNGIEIQLKLCIPFPKVEPPEINPKFQLSILKEISITDIERKPQAPWILREDNCIKFTQKIQNFSRLQINNSELSKHDKMKGQMEQQKETEREQSEINISKYEQDEHSIKDIREKLKLDDRVQKKLNQILRNKG